MYPAQQAVSAQQADAIKGVLSSYDPNNITEADAKTIVKEVRETGVAPGRPLTIVFASQGFDAQQVGNQAGIGEGQRPPPPPPSEQSGPRGQINTEALSALTLLVESKAGESITDEEWSSFYEDLEGQGIDTSQPFIDVRL